MCSDLFSSSRSSLTSWLEAMIEWCRILVGFGEAKTDANGSLYYRDHKFWFSVESGQHIGGTLFSDLLSGVR